MMDVDSSKEEYEEKKNNLVLPLMKVLREVDKKDLKIILSFFTSHCDKIGLFWDKTARFGDEIKPTWDKIPKSWDKTILSKKLSPKFFSIKWE